jgi:hypothetical protein
LELWRRGRRIQNSPDYEERSPMIDAAILPLKEHFSSLDDPCAQHSIEHLLLDFVARILGSRLNTMALPNRSG